MIVTDLAKRRRIVGDRVILVPYEKLHVEKYHAWMTDPDLRRLTGSEPLSLEEEYKMQETWVRDTDKCTFIVLEKALYDTTKDEVDSMIGDTNLYFTDHDDPYLGEIEVMIASQQCRGRGLGKEVVMLMMAFAKEVLGTERLIARIKFDNEASLNLFHRLGFVEQSRSQFFSEITLLLDLSRNCIENALSNQYEFI